MLIERCGSEDPVSFSALENHQMPNLSPDSVPIVDGKVVLFKRPRSTLWQSRFRIPKKSVRLSTKTDDLVKAKEVAREAYIGAYHKD